MSVDLPAPFSPTRAWTSPGRRSNCALVERVDAGKRLLDPLHLDEQIARRGLRCHARLRRSRWWG